MLPKGMKVKVMLPLSEKTVNNVIRQFDGTITTISNALTTPKALPQYNLDGCVSKFGKPYWFLEDWLVPWEGKVEE